MRLPSSLYKALGLVAAYVNHPKYAKEHLSRVRYLDTLNAESFTYKEDGYGERYNDSEEFGSGVLGFGPCSVKPFKESSITSTLLVPPVEAK